MCPRLLLQARKPPLQLVQPLRPAWRLRLRVPKLPPPVQKQPPSQRLPFVSGGQRVELDLASDAQREAWRAEFQRPLDRALDLLPARGVQVRTLATDAPSDAWLAALGRMQPQVA